jgi:hypothetical protein
MFTVGKIVAARATTCGRAMLPVVAPGGGEAKPACRCRLGRRGENRHKSVLEKARAFF